MMECALTTGDGCRCRSRLYRPTGLKECKKFIEHVEVVARAVGIAELNVDAEVTCTSMSKSKNSE
jgi:hypothetical protein